MAKRQEKQPLNSGTRYTTDAKRKHHSDDRSPSFNHEQKLVSRNDYNTNMGNSRSKGHTFNPRGYTK